MNWKDYRKEMCELYDIRDVVWGVPLPGESVRQMIAPGVYIASYCLTGEMFDVHPTLTISKYELGMVAFAVSPGDQF